MKTIHVAAVLSPEVQISQVEYVVYSRAEEVKVSRISRYRASVINFRQSRESEIQI